MINKAISSMTGYATATQSIEQGSLQCELRSVNSRYLDLTFRVSEELRFVEPMLREKINSRVSRGKVECRITLHCAQNSSHSFVINQNVLMQLKTAQTEIFTKLPDAHPLSVAEILRWPNLLAEEGVSAETLSAQAQQIISTALDELCATRTREGEKLVTMLLESIRLMREKVAKVEPIMPIALANYQERIAQRLRDAKASLDEDRIRQEISLFAQRVDVAEELTRLNTHLDEVARVIKVGGAVGKRLDFLMQELNREANTLASKSVSSELTSAAVDMKLYIEQMREQIQNLE